MKTGTRSPGLAPFAARLARLRASRGLSQRWVAREAGVTSATMTFLEQGNTCPRAETLSRLADVFGVTMDELWRGVGRCEDPAAAREAAGLEGEAPCPS